MDARAERTRVTAGRVVERLAAQGFADPRDVATWDAKKITIRDASELTPEQAATVAEVKHVVTQYARRSR